MPYRVDRVSGPNGRVAVAGPFALSSDADTTRSAMETNDPGVKYETVQFGGGLDHGVVTGASVTPSGQPEQSAPTTDPVSPDASSYVAPAS